jgi:hypothetical protein
MALHLFESAHRPHLNPLPQGEEDATAPGEGLRISYFFE